MRPHVKFGPYEMIPEENGPRARRWMKRFTGKKRRRAQPTCDECDRCAGVLYWHNRTERRLCRDCYIVEPVNAL